MFILTTNTACLWITDAEINAKVGHGQADACFVCDTASTQDSADTASPDSGSGDTDTDTDSDTDVDSDTDTDSDTAGDTGIDTGASFVDYVTVYGSTMVAIPAGTFCMGCGAGDPNSIWIDHDVTLTHAFWIGSTEITREAWESWSGGSGWTYTSFPQLPCTTSTTTTDCPADSVSWYDIAQYANAMSAEEGLTPCYLTDGTDLETVYLTDPYSCTGYRLPTEAEWEYAARAGEDTTYSGSNTSVDVAWTYENAASLATYSHEVGTLAPNAWGLYDMSGNVWEWVGDWFNDTHNGAPLIDPAGPVTGSGEEYEGHYRITRGGGSSYDASFAIVSYRVSMYPDYRVFYVGFRLARSIP